ILLRLTDPLDLVQRLADRIGQVGLTADLGAVGGNRRAGLRAPACELSRVSLKDLDTASELPQFLRDGFMMLDLDQNFAGAPKNRVQVADIDACGFIRGRNDAVSCRLVGDPGACRAPASFPDALRTGSAAGRRPR